MSIIQDKLEKQLIHINQVITDENYWFEDKFRVMNNEAGSGKSVQTKKDIAKLATTTDKTIIYVQMFANKDSKAQDGLELKQTVDDINKIACENIAGYLCAENMQFHEKIIAEKQVICITHKKYLGICKSGKKSNLISDSNVLIIDEFPNLFESFHVSELELTRLQGFTLITDKEKADIEDMVNFLNGKLKELEVKFGKSEMRIINLQKSDVENYIKVLKTIIKNATDDNKSGHKDIITIAEQVIQIFSHSSVYTYETLGSKKYPMLYSFNYVNYVLAKENNIILDANGAFDMRYKLKKDMFKLDNQSKVYDYTDSAINMYPIATTKTALTKYKNILYDVCNYISIKEEKRTGFGNANHNLIVTDIFNEGRLTDFQKEAYDIMCNIAIAHFGALIGKNDWRNFNNAFIIKTPFFSWAQYILQYLFYYGENMNGNTSCEIRNKKGIHNTYSIFHNKDFNNFKNSIVLGEYYQALKRIARDGRKCTFNLLMADEDIFDMVVKQFKNIKSDYKSDIILDERIEKTEKKPPKNADRLETIKNFILKAKKDGKDKIEKAEICTVANIRKDKISRQLKPMESWMRENNIIIGTGKDQAYVLIA